MPPFYRFRAALAGLALGVLLALAIAPGSRWLVHTNALLALGITDERLLPVELRPLQNDGYESLNAPSLRAPAYQSAAERRPDERTVQIAAAAPEPARGGDDDPYRGASTYKGILQRSQELLARFPNDTGVYAGLLRWACGEDIHADGGAWQAKAANRLRLTRLSAEEYAQFDRLAARGEALDPQNAYFPVMRAVGLFGAGHAAAAASALERAGNRPKWENYTADEIKGKWRLTRLVERRDSILSRLAQCSTLGFPDVVQYVRAAKLAKARVAALEKSGRAVEAFRLRRALVHIGAKMSAQDSRAIGSLVGAAIVALGESGTPGATNLPASLPPGKPGEINLAKRSMGLAGQYGRYASRLGYPEEGGMALGEARQAEARRVIISDGGFAWTPHFLGVAAWWLWAQALMNGVVLTLVLYLVCSRLAGKARQPRALAFTMAVLVLLGVTALLLQPLGLGVFERLRDIEPSTFLRNKHMELLIWEGSSCAVPLILALVRVVWARRGKVSTGAAVAEGFRRWGVPAACLLALSYGGVMVGALRVSAALDRDLIQSIQHEGRFYAQLVGKTWPE